VIIAAVRSSLALMAVGGLCGELGLVSLRPWASNRLQQRFREPPPSCCILNSGERLRRRGGQDLILGLKEAVSSGLR
jgi:hypothetical protein